MVARRSDVNLFVCAISIFFMLVPGSDGGAPGWSRTPIRGGAGDCRAASPSGIGNSSFPLGLGSPTRHGSPASRGADSLEETSAWMKPRGRSGGVGCHHQGCTKVAKYGPAGSMAVSSCAVHKLQGWVDLRSTRCCFSGGCTKIPSYGRRGDKRARTCRDHRADGDIDLRHPLCKFPEGCTRQALFALREDPHERFCHGHKTSPMVAVGARLCEGGSADGQEGACTRRPIFGSAADGRTRYCSSHRGVGDVDLVHKKCTHPEGCFRIAIWGCKGGRADRCTKHKNETHVNKMARVCRISGCSSRAIFAPVGTGPPRFNRCAQHARDGMRKASGVCIHSKCTRQAVHGEQSGAAIYCSMHKAAVHKDVKNAKCSQRGCFKRATFGGGDGGSAILCGKHSDKAVHVDVRHARCTVPECGRQAKHAIPGSKRLVACGLHKGRVTSGAHEKCTQRNLDREQPASDDAIGSQNSERRPKGRGSFGRGRLLSKHRAAHA